MPAGSRKLSRSVRNTVPMMSSGFAGGDINRYSPLGPSVPLLPAMDQATTPIHFPFPNTPIEDDFVFEILMFVFSALSGGFQFLHLYRTVWWLPQSFTSQAMNFYLIDMNLVVFSLIVLSRRLLFIMGCKLIDKFVLIKFRELSYALYKFALFGVICILLTICAYNVIQSHPVVNILYLCYPVLVYLILFGCKISSFFELINWSNSALPPLHACRSNAAEVRQEVENLKNNFNNRMKQILFSSVLNAYYAGFIPCCFAQNFLHYDVFWTTQYVIFIFLSSFVAYANHILPLRYCDILHRSALHLGNWDRLESRTMLLVNNTWNEDTLWPLGSLVRHGKDIYRAQGESNAGEPGNSSCSRFYVIFKNPAVPLAVLVLLHISVIVLQLVLLVRSIFWYYIISLTFLLFFNYYILYKIGRDYLICSKVYKEEKLMHNKINSR